MKLLLCLSEVILFAEVQAMISSEKDNAMRQNEALKKELTLLKSQSEAAVKKANDDAQKQIEEAQAGLVSREKEFGLRLAMQAKELLGECFYPHIYRFAIFACS